MKVVSAALVLILSLAVVSTLSAEEKKKGKRPGHRPAARGNQMMRMFRGLEFSDEQKEQFKELREQFDPKFKEFGEKMKNILTDEQKQARAEARKEAVEAGKKGKEMWDAVQGAVKLTDEQKEQFADLQKQMRELRKEMREKTMEILTPEQKEILKKRFEKRQKHKKDKPAKEE